MGEHIEQNGQKVKLGTCEDLNYFTFAEYCAALVAGQLKQLPHNDTPTNYIGGDYRFRFPLIQPERGFDAGLQVAVPKSLGLGTSEHRDIYQYLKTTGGGHGFNIKIPCPCSNNWNSALEYSHNTSSGSDIIAIVQQRPLDGVLWTVVRCDYCGALYRLAPDEAAKLVQFLRDGNADGVWRDVADEIERGYGADNLCAKMMALGWINQAVAA